MAYQSLYRRYRPQRFGELRGQDHVSNTLRNAVREARVGHAYLFSGPRGTGKTSTARILAKALNCVAPEDGEPCGRCDSCVDIADGRSLDVVELDAASNRGIDAMRDLVARVSLGTTGRWKVYIVDEVHMLTPEAANTLLKTLEEPPGHVIFVLATTEAHKVLPTIRSRTQHFEFRLLSPAVLAEHLRWVAADAGLEVAPEAIDLVARRGRGSARDALSVLDQVAAAGGIEHEGPSTDEVIEAICERDAGGALTALAERCAAGHDARQFARELLTRLREAFLATQARGLVGLPDEELERVEAQAHRMGAANVVRALELLGATLVQMREAPDPRVLLEVALVRLCRPDLDASPAAMLERIEKLEHTLAQRPVLAAPGGPGTRPTASTPGPSPASPPPPPGVADPAPPATGAARPALGAIRSRLKSGLTPPPAAAPAPALTPAPAVAADPAAAAPSPAAQGPFPSREDFTLAWGDEGFLASLRQPVRARYRPGRFVAVDGDTAVYSLPNAYYLDRCAELRPEVEQALSAHFGRPVQMRLQVEDAAAPVGEPAGEGSPDIDEVVDWNELSDAPPAVTSPVEHVIQAFEGAEIVEE